MLGGLAGFFSAIAGAGGLPVLPSLEPLGLDPIAALATNKLQNVFGTALTMVNSFRKGKIELHGMGRATAHTKVQVFTTNIVSLLLFISAGQVLWRSGLTMAAGQVTGARVDSNLVIRQGPEGSPPTIVAALRGRHRGCGSAGYCSMPTGPIDNGAGRGIVLLISFCRGY